MIYDCESSSGRPALPGYDPSYPFQPLQIAPNTERGRGMVVLSAAADEGQKNGRGNWVNARRIQKLGVW